MAITIFKFDKASIHGAEGVRKIQSVLIGSDNPTLLLLPSFAGIDEKLYKLAALYIKQSHEVHDVLSEIKEYHNRVANELFGSPGHPIFDEISNTFVEIDWTLEDEPHPEDGFNHAQIEAVGELLSSRIIAAFLKETGDAKWVDARSYIHTDNEYANAGINLDRTENGIAKLKPAIANTLTITQASIGSTSENFNTLLNPENSATVAALLAVGLSATGLTLWSAGSQSSELSDIHPLLAASGIDYTLQSIG